MKDFKKSTIYQIYPKSFKDSNGDGIGDLKGVIEKIDYLKNLGVDYLWLTPFYMSPQNDNGYDVKDYKNIDPGFGTIEDFENLVKKAKENNIEIMLDLVLNHTSTEHIWFQKALRGDEKYKNYYIFKKPKEGKVPTNWQSKFGGSAWEYVEEFGEYYLHLFHKTQADLNWENPELRAELYDIVNFWIDKGVTAFRLDVINLISKPKEFKDDFIGDGRRFYTDGSRIHEYLRELNKNTFGLKDNIITVGEMSSTDIENCIRYSNPKEKELSMVFNFHHLKVDYKDGNKWSLMDFDFIELKKILIEWQLGMEKGGGWNALFWSNHDQPRIVSRFGDDEKYLVESAKMLGTAIHMLRGTPYIYQGEEIGMTNPYFEEIENYRDIESVQYYDILKNKGMGHRDIMKILQSKSRDNSRTPMQWDSNQNSGFSNGKPWIDINPNYKSINVENALQDENSIFYHYKKLIDLRKKYDIISYGSFIPILEEDREIFAYIREYNKERLLIINNFYGKETNFKLPENISLEGYSIKILISNYEDSSKEIENMNLRPYESIVYHLEKQN